MLHKGKPRIFDASKSASNSRTSSTFTTNSSGNPHSTRKTLHSKSTYFYRWSNHAPVLPAFAISALLIGINIITIVRPQKAYADNLAITMSPDNPTDDTTTESNTGLNYRKYNFTVNYNVSGSTEYRIYVNVEDGHNGQLVNDTNPSFRITGVGNDVAISNFADNTWGYNLSEGNKSNSELASLSYNTVEEASASTQPSINHPVSKNGAPITHTLTFAAKFGKDAPNGHYQTKAYISIILDPVTLSTITNMQEMTNEVCANTKIGTSKTLTDVRDGAAYTVAKLKDGSTTDTQGRCWMTQNLRIVNKTISSADSNLEEGTSFSIPASVQPGNTNDFSNSDQYTAKVCYTGNTTYGAYYNHFTATAGTSNNTVNEFPTTFTNSICPKGWTLPPNGTADVSGSYSALAAAYNITDNNTSVLRQTPLNFSYSGVIITGNVGITNTDGRYWSATINDPDHAYSLAFGAKYINPSNHLNRSYGFPVRCVNDPNA